MNFVFSIRFEQKQIYSYAYSYIWYSNDTNTRNIDMWQTKWTVCWMDYKYLFSLITFSCMIWFLFLFLFLSLKMSQWTTFMKLFHFAFLSLNFVVLSSTWVMRNFFDSLALSYVHVGNKKNTTSREIGMVWMNLTKKKKRNRSTTEK